MQNCSFIQYSDPVTIYRTEDCKGSLSINTIANSNEGEKPFKNERLIVAAVVNSSCFAGLSEESRMESHVLQSPPDAGRGTAFNTYLLCRTYFACTAWFGRNGLGGELWLM